MLSGSNLPDRTTEAYQIARNVRTLKVNIRVTLRILFVWKLRDT